MIRLMRPAAICVLIAPLAAFPPKQAVLHAADDAPKPAKPDCQKAAAAAEWHWEEWRSNPLGCITQCGDRYDICLLSRKDDRLALTITVLAEGKEVYSWKGHLRSVFRILGDRLYYADFHPSGSGGRIVAVDLKSGKELWASPLKAIGPIQHSVYSNSMTLDTNDDVVTVWGNEAMRYVEFKSAATGETLGHKVFPQGDAAGKSR